MVKQAKKVADIPFSPIRKIFDQVNVLKSQGKEIISLGIGEPDFDTPSHIVEAMYEATIKGATHYTPNKGIVELRKAITDKLLADNELLYNAEEIICTAGVSEAVYVAISAFLNPCDEILIPDPAWLNYGHVTTLNDAIPVYYTLTSDNNFQINVEELERKVSDKTKMIIILDPSNPTGGVLSKENIFEIAGFAKKHDLLVLSDEIYEKIIYDGKKHYSIAVLPGMRERTIVLNGFAKAYAMTGWRLGYIAAPEELIGPMAKIHSYMVTSASSMVQWGGVAALKGSQEPLNAMVEEFKIRRDYVYNEINSIKGLSCIMPEGAFYMFVDVKNTNMDGESFASYLLETAGVAVVPGTAFGGKATHEVRISYATSLDNLKVAMGNIRKACEDLAENELSESLI
jgi:aspartate/methionine/tyrosine aminotransferase